MSGFNRREEIIFFDELECDMFLVGSLLKSLMNWWAYPENELPMSMATTTRALLAGTEKK